MKQNQTPSKQHRKFLLFSLGLAFLLHLILLSEAPLILRTIATLILTALLPGTLLVEWLVGQSEAPPKIEERALYSVGAGISLMVLTMLLLSYLPGGLLFWQTLLAFDLVLVVLLLLLYLFPATTADLAPSKASASWEPILSSSNQRWVLLALFALLLVGGFYRLLNLGYAEFQGDEARAVVWSVAVIQGYEDVLFLHKKGPTEILIPAVIYSLTGHLTEVTARLPFSFMSLTVLLVVFLFGWRLFGPLAGMVAATLLAFEGMMIAFGRITQYTSVIFLHPALALLVLYRLAQYPKAVTNYLTLAALLLATALLSHYEAALVFFPAAYLLWQLWLHLRERLIYALLWPFLLALSILLSFYVPFVLHPNFASTYNVYRGDHVGNALIYNNLLIFFETLTIYNTTYYLILMLILVLLALAYLYWRSIKWGALLAAILGVGVLLTIFFPNWLTIGDTDYTAFFFSLALLLGWLMPQQTVAERTVWLWFGIPLLISVFFMKRPALHFYNFFIPWTLLSGMMIGFGWRWLKSHLGVIRALVVALPVVLIVVTLFGSYAFWVFIYDEEFTQTWQKPAIFWTVHDKPTKPYIFGFPHKSGWKTIGALYQEGVLAPDGAHPQGMIYDSNNRVWISEWYSQGAEYCQHKPHYFFVDALKGRSEQPELIEKLQSRSYQLFGTVLVDEQPGLYIYQKSETPLTPQTFNAAKYERRFDDYPAGHSMMLGAETVGPRHKVRYRLGEGIWLVGYSLERDASPIQPSETVIVTLFWEVTAQVEQKFTVFNQILGPNQTLIGQRDGEPICTDGSTSNWEVGELYSQRYAIPIAPDAQAGTYPLLTGMYQLETLERLPVVDENGQPIEGNAIELTIITIDPIR